MYRLLCYCHLMRGSSSRGHQVIYLGQRLIMAGVWMVGSPTVSRLITSSHPYISIIHPCGTGVKPPPRMTQNIGKILTKRLK
jgi:hypothetical protein